MQVRSQDFFLGGGGVSPYIKMKQMGTLHKFYDTYIHYNFTSNMAAIDGCFDIQKIPLDYATVVM